MVVSKTTAVFHNGKRRILIFAGLLFNTVTTKLGLGCATEVQYIKVNI